MNENKNGASRNLEKALEYIKDVLKVIDTMLIFRNT